MLACRRAGRAGVPACRRAGVPACRRAGVPACQINRLHAILNSAARLIYGRSLYDHVTDLIRDRLHWLPIEHRVGFKCVKVCVQSVTRHRSFIHRPILCQTTRRRASLRVEICGSFSTRLGCFRNDNSVWRTLLHCRRSIDLELFAGLRQGCRVVGYF